MWINDANLVLASSQLNAVIRFAHRKNTLFANIAEQEEAIKKYIVTNPWMMRERKKSVPATIRVLAVDRRGGKFELVVQNRFRVSHLSSFTKYLAELAQGLDDLHLEDVAHVWCSAFLTGERKFRKDIFPKPREPLLL